MTKTLYATMKALPEQRAELLVLLRDLTENVRAEAGNIRFVVYTLASDPSCIHVEESYADEQAFQVHINTPHCIAFNKAIVPLVQHGRSEVVFLVSPSWGEVA